VRLTVLAVPGCPNATLLEQRLAEVLRGRSDITVSRHEVADQDQAVRLGMYGSPALLIDGIDPFAGPGQTASASCRLYRDETGSTGGAPSARQLREAITHPVSIAADTGARTWLDTLGRDDSRRVAPAERRLRAVHQVVLHAFAATGAPPGRDLLDPAARPFDSGQVLAELAAGDYLCLGQDGQITAAYPFSATPTPHTVQITGGAVTWSMCAIDALGISAMLSTPVQITSADPATGERVTVAVTRSSATWDPDTAVVFAGRTASACPGPSAVTCCGHINFFTSHATAAEWAGARPGITGAILSQARALHTGQQIFGQLLR
jgi:Alkylmercury lyase